MEKWTGQLAPPPYWLDPKREVTAADEPPKLAKAAFVIQVITSLLVLGCTLEQALGVAANVMNETAWGKSYRAYNLGGWKIYRDAARDPDGTPRRWWRALGNKSSGDAQTCFYRAFFSIAEFLGSWLNVFVPKVDPGKKPNGRYWKTGQQFWAGEEWFDDLIAAGYKGDVTRRKPLNSMREHASIIKSLLVYWCQHLLGVPVDGKWGPVTRGALKKFQHAASLRETGELDAETVEALCQGPALPKAVAGDVSMLFAGNHDAEDEDEADAPEVLASADAPVDAPDDEPGADTPVDGVSAKVDAVFASLTPDEDDAGESVELEEGEDDKSDETQPV